MGESTILADHRGWADLSNYVLRCHLPLQVEKDSSGVLCCNEY